MESKPIAKQIYLEGTSCKKLSVEEMNKIILEKIPLDERLRSVYLPIIAMDCACYLAEDLLGMLKVLRLEPTKKLSRVIRSCVEGYRGDNRKAMNTSLYKDLSSFTKEFYSSMTLNMTLYCIQYQQLLLKMNLDFSREIQKTIAIAYVTREIVQFVIDMDRTFSKRISDTLGKGITYTTEDNHYCLELIKAINEFFQILGIPNNLRTEQTDTAFRVFKNKVKSIKI